MLAKGKKAAAAALEAGCDVISEKPMTTDEVKCRRVLAAARANPGSVTVTFNYRYDPVHEKVRELLAGGAIGEVASVHFEWLLDVRHGADYFRRWHRDKRNSGGLMVHKATHHFDLINWWLDSSPETVFAFGDLKFYGRENAEERGETRFYLPDQYLVDLARIALVLVPASQERDDGDEPHDE